MPEFQRRLESARRRLADVLGGRAPAEEPRILQRLQERVQHLETLVEGLQDSVHRETTRQEQRMLDLERKTEPDALAKALSEDARRRGL
jgi:hypothetical protein